MVHIYRHCAGALIVALAVTGCSSASVTSRASLTSDSTAYEAPARQGRLADIRYWDGGAAAGYSGSAPGPAGPSVLSPPAPQRHRWAPNWRGSTNEAPRPPGARPQLQRFAAMPRHMPHAPHVRQHEGACLNSGIVQPTRFIRPKSSIGGGQCYIARPFMMTAAAGGRVRFEPPATLRCQMVPSVETWVREILRPAARKYMGSDIVQMKIAGSYGCRTRNHKVGGRLSEHGRANALDISEFYFADGRVVTVKRGWRGATGERRFLHYIHRGACEHFSTVLGPNADRHHHDHFHFDLASHGRDGTYRVCK